MIHISYEQHNILRKIITDKTTYKKEINKLFKDKTVIKIFIHKREDKNAIIKM